MKVTMKRITAGALAMALAAGLAACATQEKKNKAAIANFKQNATGEFQERERREAVHRAGARTHGDG